MEMLGILGGLVTGILAALFLPFAIVLGMVVLFLIIAMLPQMQMLRMFALMALFAMVAVTVIRLYVWTDISESLSVIVSLMR